MKNKIEFFLDRDVYSILGLPFDFVSLDDAIDIVGKAIEQEQPCFLSTPNLNFAIATQSDDAFFQSVVESDLSVADGMPLIWVAKLLGIPLPERVAGSTLFDELSKQEGISKKIRVFFFGGQQGVAELAHQKLNETSVAMESCGFYDPGFVFVDEMSDSRIIEQINRCEPDFIVVALGARKGQEWIQKNKEKLNAPVISHLGAVINFVAGNVERAPVVWQRFGMEWLWRIRQEPTLWKRYLFDGFAFLRLLVLNVLPLAIYDRILRRSECFNEACEIELEPKQKVKIKLMGSIHHQTMQQLKQELSIVIEEYEDDVVIECEQLTYVDSAFIATMLLFQRYLNKQGRALVLDNVSSRIIRILRLSSAIKRFTLL
ncbi:MAG: WecB/TagA/CpsF family glycosyltransferase [Methylophaga sp.]|nr:WecB/TagA/CpsF family glycosyltransferase [Methylophaga sp.]